MELKNPIETTYRYEFGIYRYEKARKQILERDQKVQEAIQKGIFKNKKMKKINDEIVQEIRRTTDDLLNLIDRITGQVCSPEEFDHLRSAAIVANGHLSILINENFSKLAHPYKTIPKNLGVVLRRDIFLDSWLRSAFLVLSLAAFTISGIFAYSLQHFIYFLLFSVAGELITIFALWLFYKFETGFLIDKSHREIYKHLYYVKKEYVPVSDSLLKIIKTIRK